MKESTQKEKVLKAVRDALVSSMPPPFEELDMDSSLYNPVDPDMLDIHFAEAFSNTHGQFVFCADLDEMSRALSAIVAEKGLERIYCGESYLGSLLEELGMDCCPEEELAQSCDAALTACEALVARLGSVVVSSRQGAGRKGVIAASVHIVVATTAQLVPDISAAFRLLKEKYQTQMPSLVSFITGPSRTADIEKTLVLGAHGPKELYVLLVDLEQSANN